MDPVFIHATLVAQLESMYASEIHIQHQIAELLSAKEIPQRSSAISIEAEENRSQCERLEGLLSVMTDQAFLSQTESSLLSSLESCRVILIRILRRGTSLRYLGCAQAAISAGRYNIAEELMKREQLCPEALQMN